MRVGDFGVFSLLFLNWTFGFFLIVKFLSKTPFSPTLTYPVPLPFLFIIIRAPARASACAHAR